MTESSKKAVDNIIKDLDRIPRVIETKIPIKKIADQVSKIQEKEIRRRTSSG